MTAEILGELSYHDCDRMGTKTLDFGRKSYDVKLWLQGNDNVIVRKQKPFS